MPNTEIQSIRLALNCADADLQGILQSDGINKYAIDRGAVSQTRKEIKKALKSLAVLELQISKAK